jgi:hypothetical protein
LDIRTRFLRGLLWGRRRHLPRQLGRSHALQDCVDSLLVDLNAERPHQFRLGKGLRDELKIRGAGTPLVVFAKNPKTTPEEMYYPSSGIALAITAVKEERQGKVPLLKLYDSLDPLVARSSTGPHSIAANYTAALAVLYSQAKKVGGSAGGSFLRPDNPRFATGVYLIQPYDPDKIPVLFVHGLISSPLSWQNLVNDLCADPKILEHYQPWFFLYPTGQPALESAAQLREDLGATFIRPQRHRDRLAPCCRHRSQHGRVAGAHFGIRFWRCALERVCDQAPE